MIKSLFNLQGLLGRMLLLAVCLMSMNFAFAARPRIEWKKYMQPDGTHLTLTLWGDADFYGYRDQEGHLYSRDSLGIFHLLPPSSSDSASSPFYPARATTRLSVTNTQWDAQRTYRQLVILVSFSDFDFITEDPLATYQRIFNEQGYNERNGAGCVADYFREQSSGLFNLQFDVYGPYKTSSKVTSSTATRNEGRAAFREATLMLMDEHPDIDFSLYDWDGDRQIEQVVYVYAGLSGNQAGKEEYIWPTTGSFSTITTPDNLKLSQYSASAEHFTNTISCGIGTICHEYSHCLGLPDIYPTSSAVNAISIVDEWDLMDGGHFTNLGWCPPHYSPLEKMTLGWLSPLPLTADTVVSHLRPVAEGGSAFVIHHNADEYYLLENRQQRGWDFGLPGSGLLVYHVMYSASRWQNNTVNNIDGKPSYSIVAADDRDYNDWYNQIMQEGGKSPYQQAPCLNSLILSTAPYPLLLDGEVVNDQLSPTSHPSTQMYSEDAEGATVLSKAITDITRHDDGTLSFTFHADGGAAAITAPAAPAARQRGIFSLSGQRIASDVAPASLPKGIYIINGRKVVR